MLKKEKYQCLRKGRNWGMAFEKAEDCTEHLEGVLREIKGRLRIKTGWRGTKDQLYLYSLRLILTINRLDANQF